MQSLGRVQVALFSILTVAAPLFAADWPRFRGPNGSGSSPDTKPTPTTWSDTENVRWKLELPGRGVSSPIVVGERLFVTCYSGYGMSRSNPGDQNNLKRHLVCIDRQTGKTLWNKTVDAVLPEDPFSGIGVPTHGYASHTPVSDGKNVYVFFGKTGALAFDLQGNQLWQTSVGTESDPRRWGSASSPIVYGNLLIVVASAESEALVALDKESGKEVWRQEAAGFSNCWSTPILVEVDKTRTDLVIGVPYEIWAFNPETGQLRWYCETMQSDQACCSVVVDDGVIYAIAGRGGGAIAVRAGGNGDVTQSHVLWTSRDSSRFSTPIASEGRVYFFVDGGIANCIDAKTGAKLSQVRFTGASSRVPALDQSQGGERKERGDALGGRGGQGGFSGRGRGGIGGGDYSSPVMADGKLYFLRANGDVWVLKTGETLQQLTVNRLTEEGGDFMATPAISDGQIFLRSNRFLYCVAEKEK